MLEAPEGEQIWDRKNIDQEFSKTEKEAKTQIKEALWIPSRKNTNKAILKPIIDLIAKNQRKRKS